jgi:fatty-acyl-CoA synthase
MNIGEWITKRALVHPERPFLKHEDLTLDNRQFNQRVNRMAHTLRGLGAVRFERVAVLMNNSPEFLELLFACAKLGAIIVPVNTRLAVPELACLLADAGPQVVVCSPEVVEKAEQVRKSVPFGRLLVQGASPVGEAEPLEALLAPFPETEPVTEAPIDLPDAFMIMYTSGTTGQSKGAVLTHGNFLFGAIHSLLGYGLGPGCKSLVVAPMCHIGALAASVTPVIYAGGSLVIRPFDNPSDVLDLIVREGITYMFAVPVMFEMLTQTPGWPSADFSRVDFFIAGGAPMPVPLIRTYQEEKGVRFAQGYGMTESLRITSLDLADAIRKSGSVGKEVFHTFLRIVDDGGQELPRGEVGQILVKGPTVFREYWKKPEETAAAFRDGWFATGDLGRRDEEGFIYLSGRKIDLIISSGENIYAVEVERAIEAVPGVAAAAAVGVPDPKRGEVVAAYVQREPGAGVTETDITTSLRETIAPFKIPKRVYFVETLPRNSAGKIMKHRLSPPGGG